MRAYLFDSAGLIYNWLESEVEINASFLAYALLVSELADQIVDLGGEPKSIEGPELAKRFDALVNKSIPRAMCLVRKELTCPQ